MPVSYTHLGGTIRRIDKAEIFSCKACRTDAALSGFHDLDVRDRIAGGNPAVILSDETAKLDVRVGCGQLDTRCLRRTFSNRAVIAAHKPADTGGTVAVSIKRERVARSRTVADRPGISACQHTAVSDCPAARDIAAKADIAVLPSGICLLYTS